MIFVCAIRIKIEYEEGKIGHLANDHNADYVGCFKIVYERENKIKCIDDNEGNIYKNENVITICAEMLACLALSKSQGAISQRAKTLSG